MTENKGSLLARLARLFGKKVDLEETMSTLRKEIRDIEKQCWGVEHDMKLAETQRQEVIRKGTEAARKGRSAEKSKCAMRLQMLNARLGQMRQRHAMMARTQCVAELALGKLEAITPDGALDAVGRIQKFLTDTQVDKLLDDAQLSTEAFAREAEKLMNVAFRELEAEDVTTSAEIGSYDSLFDELAQAEQAGDSKRAQQLREQMTRDGSENHRFDSLLDS